MSKYINKAMHFAQGAARMSLKVSEELVDNAREFNNELEGESYENSEIRLENVVNELNSNFTKEKLIGLKRLIILIGRGFDVSIYFPEVVKNVSSNIIEIKKLVYIYLLEYAETNPDLALLSINSFQKDLNDPNHHIRAMALRILSGIKIKEISTIIAIAIKKGTSDPSPHVRKYAALAAIKLYRNDPEMSSELVGMMEDMLKERSFHVIGAVVKAFQVVCNNDPNLIHAHFRRCCELLLDADEWSQIALVQMLVYYARTQFENPNTNSLEDGSTHKDNPEKKDTANLQAASSTLKNYKIKKLTKLDEDHELLILSLSKLLYSQNNAVIMSAIYGLYEIVPVDRLEIIWKPLMRVIKSCPEVEYIALHNISQIIDRYNVLFLGNSAGFFIKPHNSAKVKLFKLNLIQRLVNQDCAKATLNELLDYIKTWSSPIVSDVAVTISKCVLKVGIYSKKYLSSLVSLLENKNEYVVEGSVKGFCILLSQKSFDAANLVTPNQRNNLTCALIRLLPALKPGSTRAYLYRLMSQLTMQKYTHYSENVLRFGCSSFKSECVYSKKEILTLCSTIIFINRLNPSSNSGIETGYLSRILDLHEYLFKLARYDSDYSIRDWARALRSVFPTFSDNPESDLKEHEKIPAKSEISYVIDYYSSFDKDENKLFNLISRNFEEFDFSNKHILNRFKNNFAINSLSSVLGTEVSGYFDLPDWPTTKPNHNLRGNTTNAVGLQERINSSTRTYLPGISPITNMNKSTNKHKDPFKTSSLNKLGDPYLTSDNFEDLEGEYKIQLLSEADIERHRNIGDNRDRDALESKEASNSDEDLENFLNETDKRYLPEKKPSSATGSNQRSSRQATNAGNSIMFFGRNYSTSTDDSDSGDSVDTDSSSGLDIGYYGAGKKDLPLVLSSANSNVTRTPKNFEHGTSRIQINNNPNPWVSNTDHGHDSDNPTANDKQPLLKDAKNTDLTAIAGDKISDSKSNAGGGFSTKMIDSLPEISEHNSLEIGNGNQWREISTNDLGQLSAITKASSTQELSLVHSEPDSGSLYSTHLGKSGSVPVSLDYNVAVADSISLDLNQKLKYQFENHSGDKYISETNSESAQKTKTESSNLIQNHKMSFDEIENHWQ